MKRNFRSVLFFLMLLALGFDSQFCILEALITGIVDNWPKVLMVFELMLRLIVLLIKLFKKGPPAATPSLHCGDGGVHAAAGHPDDHAGRHLRLPAHGLLLCLGHVPLVVRLLPDRRSHVLLRGKQVLRLHRTGL